MEKSTHFQHTSISYLTGWQTALHNFERWNQEGSGRAQRPMKSKKNRSRG